MWLVEYDTGDKFGPASEENISAYKKATENGKGFFRYGYHGYELRMIVVSEKLLPHVQEILKNQK